MGGGRERGGAPQSKRNFLKQLAGVKKFGFMAGQLALSYETDGVWGVMLFDPRGMPAALR